MNGWFTLADVDGLTVEHVLFARREDGKPVELKDTNPKFRFSQRIVIYMLHNCGAFASSDFVRGGAVRGQLAKNSRQMVAGETLQAGISML